MWLIVKICVWFQLSVLLIAGYAYGKPTFGREHVHIRIHLAEPEIHHDHHDHGHGHGGGGGGHDDIIGPIIGGLYGGRFNFSSLSIDHDHLVKEKFN